MSASVTPNGTLTFVVSQGTPPYNQPSLVNGTGSTSTITFDGMDIVYTAMGTEGTTDTLTITDSVYDQSNTVSITLNPPIAASPDSATVVSGSTQCFTASGGDSGVYDWAFDTMNGTIGNKSGGSLSGTDPSCMGELYTAGPTSNVVDTIMISDSTGGYSLLNVSVGVAVSITEGNVTVVTNATQQFDATGGLPAMPGKYTWSVLSGGTGGGSISGTGIYKAGAMPSTPTTTLQDTVQASDGNGHTATVTVTIAQAFAISPSMSTVDDGGSEQLSTANGSGSVTWTILTDNTGTMTHPANVTSGGFYTAGHVPGKTDTIEAMDAAGNIATATVTTGAGITYTAAPTSSPLGTTPMGTIVFTPMGGSGSGYTWVLAPASMTMPRSGGSVSTDPMTGVATYIAGIAGSVTDVLTVTDSNSNKVSINIAVSPGITFTPPVTSSVEPKGTATFTATGGNNDITYTLHPNNSNGTISTVSGSGAYVAGTAGGVNGTTDTVVATDTLGNTNSTQVSVGGGIVITPSSETVYPKSTTALSAKGGAGAPYTFTLEASPHGSIVTTMTTACATPPCYVAGAGVTSGPNPTDTVTATDGNNNTSTITFTISPAITISPSSLSIAPAGEQTFTAAGGNNGPYTWTLSSTPSGTLAADKTNGEDYTAGATGSVMDLLTATDALGNSATANITVTAALTLTANETSVAPQGTAKFTAAGGNSSKYTYAVTTKGSSGTIRAASIDSSGNYQAGNVGGTGITDTITVTDANGVSKSLSIGVTTGVSITPSLAATAPSGRLSFAAAGGNTTGGYTWSVSINNSQGATIDQNGNYVAGTTGGSTIVDTIKVVDANTNYATAQVSVGGIAIGPATPTVAPHGTINAFMAVGGTGTGFTWKLSPSASGGSINSTSGVYVAGGVGNVKDTVIVTDSGGNTGREQITVSAPVSITPTMTTIQSGNTQSFSVTGGSGSGYVWSLSTNVSGATINTNGVYTAGTVAGTDVVQVTDSLGSAATALVNVTVPVVVSPDMGTADMSAKDDMAMHEESDAAVETDAAMADKSKGGGCDLGGAGSASPLALVLGATIIVLLRRRRARS